MPPTKAPKAPRKAVLRRVPLLVRAEGARQVAVTGDFTQWSNQGFALAPVAGGDWSITLELAPGEYQYRLIVDGEWRDHPEAGERVPNPFGTYNSVLKVT